MNIQLYAYENNVRYQLDLFEEEPIKITLTAEDITDPTVVTSSFTRQFRIPATSANSKFFKYWFEAGVISFDITKLVKSEIHVDGILYKTGQLRLLAAYSNGKNDNTELELIFLGETKDFSSQVGDYFMSELDLVDKSHLLTLLNVEKSWLPLTDSNVLLDGAVRYILAERGYSYNENNNNQEPVPGQTNASEVAVDGSACVPCNQNHSDSFTKSAHPLFISQFTPIVQAKYLIDKIFAQTDYTYSSDSVFNDTWFQDLYIDGIGAIALPFTPNSDGNFDVDVNNVQPVIEFQSIPFNIVNQNNANAYSTTTYQYTIPADGTYVFSSTLEGQVRNNGNVGQPGPQATAGIYRNGSAIDSDTQTGGIGLLNYSFNLTYSGNFFAGQKIDVIMSFQNLDFPPVLFTGNFNATISPLQIAVNDLMKTDLKQIDWFKSILTKFRLVMVPSIDKVNEFIIQPWQEYIGTGDSFDWTDKLDYSKDNKLEPLFYEQANRIIFEDQKGEDQANIYHQDTFGIVYGRKVFESGNELLTDVKTTTTEFAPTPVNRIDGGPIGSNFIVPKFAKAGDTVSAPDGYLQQLPLDITQRLLFWNGLRTTKLTNGLSPITWYYTDGVTTKNSDEPPLNVTGSNNNDQYPCASYLTEIPSIATSLNLNWNRTFAYFELDGGPAGTLGESVYERYWKAYIGNIYSPDARKLTAYFNLNSEDLRNLTFDDVIFIKDSYWRLNKIYDAPLGEVATLKCELIKILDYLPITGFTAVDDLQTDTSEFRVTQDTTYWADRNNNVTNVTPDDGTETP
tara:strand:+ start:4318 stop:6696 length:2379 start_codon:yes stop_codon:yes gene_type:complete